MAALMGSESTTFTLDVCPLTNTSRTRALLEIANILNSRSDFGELTSHVLERANELVGADYCALGVVGPSGKAISSSRLEWTT